MNDLAVLEKEQLEGVDPSKAAAIKATFEPMVKMLESFEEAFTEVTGKEINPETCKEAKRLRLDIGKIRVSADKARKTQKEEHLRAGNAIQGVYNILKFAVTDKEEKLKAIEQHFERIEAERTAKLQADRQIELAQYEADGEFIDLGKMTDEVWNNYLTGVRLNYEAVKEAEQKAEFERLAREEAEKAEQDRIRAENEQLKKEAEEEREKFRLSREAADKENARIHAENEGKLRAERDEQERLKNEAREAEETRQAEEAKKAAAPDIERLNEIYLYLKEQYKAAQGQEARNGIAEAGLKITTTISLLK